MPSPTSPRSKRAAPKLNYRSLFRNELGSILILSPDLVVLDATDSYLEAIGRSREEIVGHALEEVLPDQGNAAAAGFSYLHGSLERVLRTRRTAAVEAQGYGIRRRRRDGRVLRDRYVRGVSTPFLDARGEIRHIVHRLCSVADPGRDDEDLPRLAYRGEPEHERDVQGSSGPPGMREARQPSPPDSVGPPERHAREVLESVTDAFVTVDRSGRVTYANAAAARLLRRSRQELVGRTIRGLLPEVGAPVEEQCRKAAAGYRTRPYEAHVAPLDLWMSLRVHPSPVGVSIHLLDITEAKRAEADVHARIRDFEERNRLLDIACRTAHVGGWVAELAEGVVRWSDEVYDLHDVPRGTQMTFDEALSFYAPEHRRLLEETFGACVEHGTPFELELELVSRKGRHMGVRAFGEAVRGPEGRVERVEGAVQDITDRRAAEESLRRSEEMLRQITENIREIFWMFDPGFTRAIYISPAYEEIWGCSTSELYQEARSFLDHVHPEDLERVLAALDRVSNGSPMEVEYRVVRDDGSVRWAETRGFPVLDVGGEVHRVVGTTEDITERKAAEADRAIAEAHYRRLVETSPYAIFVLDAAGRFTELNQAAVEVIGRDARELLGRHLSEVIAPEDLPRVEHERSERAANRRDVVDQELRIVRPSGQRRLVHVRSSLIRLDGEVVGTHGIVRDITEERARLAEMRLLAAALESLDEGVSVSRPDGAVVYANSTHARLFGYDRERVGDLNQQELLAGEFRLEADTVAASIAERGRWIGRLERRHPDTGRVIPLEVIIEEVEGQGGESLLFTIARDITTQVEQERHLRRTERLASVGTLVGGVAHELNNPLHAIRNFAELLLMDERPADDQEALEIVRREADRAANVVADLRSVARRTQEVERERETVDLHDVVRHVLKVRRYSLDTGNVEVRQDLATDLPPVWANRGEIEQVILNLVVNAEQALAAHGEGRILTLRTRRTPEGAAVHVIDNGPGILPEHLERIFDPFFTTKSPGEGTGLGLALVHGIVTEYGGQIQVESEVGKGAAFRIDLPRAPAQEEPAAGDLSNPLSPQSLRILIVDDEEAVREVSRRYLERVGYRVDAAEEGEKALRLIEEAEFDVIISDLRMPGLDGQGLLQRLREQGRDLERRLVFLTGDAASAQIARMGADLNVPILVKPLRLDALAQTIERVTRQTPPAQDT